MGVSWGTRRTSEVSRLELTPGGLEYVRHAMVASKVLEPQARGSSDAGVRWRQDRERWLAVRPGTDGKPMQKTFKPRDNSAEAKEEALSDAKAWALGGGGDDPATADSLKETQD